MPTAIHHEACKPARHAVRNAPPIEALRKTAVHKDDRGPFAEAAEANARSVPGADKLLDGLIPRSIETFSF
jgi:hypothetical protein